MENTAEKFVINVSAPVKLNNESGIAVDKQSAPIEVAEVRSATPGDKDVTDLSAGLGILEIDGEKKINEFLDEPLELDITTVTETLYKSATTFEDLHLSEELLKGLYVEMKFHTPSKIQAKSLPMILDPPYKDLIAQAHNGSGKTTCFVLGMLSRIDPELKAPQAICVCPTIELAKQNLEVLRKMAKFTGITSECAVPRNPADTTNNIPISKRPPVMSQVVIGTAGTIKRWMVEKKLGASCVKILVFDEADHMLDEDGQKDESLRITKYIENASPDCQVLLFSATFNETVKNFISRVIKKDYNQLFVKKEELSLDSIKQYKVIVPEELSKIMVIKDRILELGENVGQTIIFVNTKHNASQLRMALVELGYEVTLIKGDLSQEVRDNVIKEFKDGLTQVLISTDLLARGFDQQHVNLVINYDLPIKFDQHKRPTQEPNYETYLHRIGRAGRFGRKAVFNLLCGERERSSMNKIENHFRTKIAEVPSWKSEEDFRAALQAARLQ